MRETSGTDMTAEQMKATLDQIRDWLKQGATIKAMDTNGLVLEPWVDGAVYGGMLVDWSGVEGGVGMRVNVLGAASQETGA